MSGQNTGVCSEVIRHTDKGAWAGAHPAPALMGPRAGTSLGNRFASGAPACALARGRPGPWRGADACYGRAGPWQPDTQRDRRRREPRVLGEVQSQRDEPRDADRGVQPPAELADLSLIHISEPTRL